MFNPTPRGCESQSEIDSITTTDPSVRSLGLMQQPAFHGVICLPDVHQDVPHEVLSSGLGAHVALANWSLHAHANGLSIPDIEFTGLTDTVKKQVENYINSVTCTAKDDLPLVLSVSAEASFVDIGIFPTNNPKVILLKNWTMHLNSVFGGLGWWAFSIVSKASFIYPTYSLENLGDMLSFSQSWGRNNKEVVEYLNDEEGGSENEEYFRENYTIVWPSDLVDELDGHGWMVGIDGQQSKPRPITSKQAKEFLKSSTDEVLNTFVKDCLKLYALINTKSNSFAHQQTFGNVCVKEDDYCDSLGASSVIGWSSVDIHWEAISHYEEAMMNCGEYQDELRSWRIDISDETAMYSGLKSIKTFIKLHALFGRVINQYGN